MQTEVYWTTEALVNSVIQFSFSKTAHNKELQMNYLTLSIHCLELEYQSLVMILTYFPTVLKLSGKYWTAYGATCEWR